MGTNERPCCDVERLEGARDVDGLMQLLQDNRNNLLGWEAAEALVRLRDQRAVAPLCVTLSHECAPARQHAARLLGELGAISSTGPLTHTLRDRDRHVRAAAALALGRLRAGDALDHLLEALGDDEPCVRAAAAEALGLLADPRAAATLETLLTDDSSRVRERTRQALRTIGARAEPLAPLPPQGAGPGEPVRAEPDPDTETLLDTLDGSDAEARLEAARRLAARRELRAIEPLIRGFRSGDDRYHETVAGLLAEMGPVAHVALMQALGDPEPGIRAGSVTALGAAGVESARGVMAVALRDPAAIVRAAAADALGRIGATETKRALVRALRDTDRLVRGRAAGALERLGWSPRGPAVRAGWLVALGRWEEAVALGEDAVGAIAAELDGDGGSARRSAAEALVRIGAAAVPTLLGILRGGDPLARELAAWALGELRPGEAVAPLDEALADPNPGVRAAALTALDKYDDERLFDSVLRALDDEADSVRARALEAVGHLGNGRAGDAVIGRLEDLSPAVRRTAAEVVGRLHETRAIRPLLRMLRDDDREVRAAAEQAIAAVMGTAGEEPAGSQRRS